MNQKPSEIVAIKVAVRERDAQRCTECGMTADEHIACTGKTLEVHRLMPGSPYSLEGCVTLCKRCHGPKPRSERIRFRGGYSLHISRSHWSKLSIVADHHRMAPWCFVDAILRPLIERDFAQLHSAQIAD